MTLLTVALFLLLSTIFASSCRHFNVTSCITGHAGILPQRAVITEVSGPKMRITSTKICWHACKILAVNEIIAGLVECLMGLVCCCIKSWTKVFAFWAAYYMIVCTSVFSVLASLALVIKAWILNPWPRIHCHSRCVIYVLQMLVPVWNPTC